MTEWNYFRIKPHQWCHGLILLLWWETMKMQIFYTTEQIDIKKLVPNQVVEVGAVCQRWWKFYSSWVGGNSHSSVYHNLPTVPVGNTAGTTLPYRKHFLESIWAMITSRDDCTWSIQCIFVCCEKGSLSFTFTAHDFMSNVFCSCVLRVFRGNCFVKSSTRSQFHFWKILKGIVQTFRKYTFPLFGCNLKR